MSKNLPPEIQAWLRIWREVLLDPLRTLRWNAWSIQRMADELALRVAGRGHAGTDGRLRDVSGVSKTTLQKEMAGDRMPTRDVVQHLLDIAVEHLPSPPSPESQKALWDAYYPALERKIPLLASLYRAIDERDEALRALAAAEERESHLREALRRQEQDSRVRPAWFQAGSDIERAEDIARKHRIRVPGLRSDTYEERLRSLSSAGGVLSLQLEVLTDELDQLRGQRNPVKRAAWRALRAVKPAQRKRERELTAQWNALQKDRVELLQLLESVERNLGRADLREREYLDQELAHAHRELEVALVEARHRDADLAQLVESLSTRIASLRESSVLSEADDVLAAALEQLSPRL
ncbi:hypothetical protein ACIQ7Q_34235 [Streptomyces sp. NPDC096176]|uniref:hypothetical protein n=1 Tax=Streptomyces sp. NPDC096176 TaxID=3366079 RepID=UPI0037FD9ECF